MSNQKVSLASRAIIALVLMVLFYALAAASIAGLAYAGMKLFLLLPDLRSGRGMLALVVIGVACWFAGGVVLWSVLPRIDKFEPPGPEILPADAPELFKEIRRVATQMSEAMPSHVYLVPEVNAFVTERGGTMGFGSRRVMGIGLPLLQLLTVAEMRGVIAHEFGHFYGGDTKLGPWIYKTRGAIGRTVVNLAGASEVGEEHNAFTLVIAAVKKPFAWFGAAFMRVTQAISRHQEYQADALAARMVGSSTKVSALEKVTGGALAYSLYYNNEVHPFVSNGFLPPLAQGFATLLATEKVKDLFTTVVEHEHEHGEQDPYDSHPPLAKRCEALRLLGCPDREADDRTAIELLPDPSKLEEALAPLLAAESEHKELSKASWEDAIDKVYKPEWKRSRERLFSLLSHSDLTPATLPTEMRSMHKLLELEIGEYANYVDDQTLMDWAANSYGTALVLLLLDRGFEARSGIGESIRLSSMGIDVDPYTEAGNYVNSQTPADEWRSRMMEIGIADVPFAVAEPIGESAA